MNHKLNFFIASGSSQTLTKFPGVQELIKGLAPHACGLGEEQRNEAREERPIASWEAALCPWFAFGSWRGFFRGVAALGSSGVAGKSGIQAATLDSTIPLQL